MPPRTHYQVLQVDPAASPEVIDAAYRGLAKKHHPDVSTDPNAVRIMQEINQAYSVLRDPRERQRYDEALRVTQGEQHQQSVNEQSAEKHTSSTRGSYEYTRSQAYPPPGFPVQCQKCGKSDATLRLAVFPYVFSIVILTFRRAWSGIYCTRCRTEKMTGAKLLSLFFGWWGIPFGIIYTLGVLFKPSQGDVPAQANGPYLRALGAHFLETGRISDAEQALNASLAYQYDPEVATVYQQVFGKNPDPKKHNASNGSGSGALFGIAALFGIIMWALLLTGAWSRPGDPTGVPPSVAPTRVATFAPSAKAIETATAVIVPQGWMPYHSEQGNFSALIPIDYVPEEQPPTSDKPARSTFFAPRTAQSEPKMIYVQAVPLPQTGETRPPSQAELIQTASNWMEKNQSAVIVPPASVKLDGCIAVKMVYDEAPLGDSNDRVRVYSAWIVAPGWQYLLAVYSLSAPDSDLQEYFDVFFESFVPDGQ